MQPISPEVDYALAKKLDRTSRRGPQRWIRAMTAKSLDQASRKAFPLSFFIFNVIYWVVYTRPTDDCAHNNQPCAADYSLYNLTDQI